MTFVGMVFVLLGLGLSLAMSSARRSLIPLWLFLYHAAFATVYWAYSLNYGSDASGYYNNGQYFDPAVGTHFVMWLTARIREITEGSYLDLFMLFHIGGYVGLVRFFDLLRPLGEQSKALNQLTTVLLFMPGLHFWTSAIGKDSIAFFGIMTFLVSVHAANRLSVGAVIGLVVCASVRPHMALLLVASWGLVVLFGSKSSAVLRLATLMVLGAAAILAAPWVADYVGLDSMDADAVTEYTETRQQTNLSGGSSVDISEYPFPLKFFTFMFRPLFLDTSGPMGLVVSLENLLYLILVLRTVPRIYRLLWGEGASAFARLNVLFWFVGVSVLGSTMANLGLAIRQKTMVLPSFLLIVVTSMAAAKRQQSTDNTRATRATLSSPVVRGPVQLTSRKGT